MSERVGRWLCIVTLFISYMRLCGVISYTIRSLWYSHDESSSNWTSRRSSVQWMIDGYMTRLVRIYATSIFFWVFDECNIHMWWFCNFIYFFQKQHNISLCFLQLMLTFEFYLYESASLDQFPSNSITRISFHTRDDRLPESVRFVLKMTHVRQTHKIDIELFNLRNIIRLLFFRNFYNSISSFSVSALFSVFFGRKTLFRVENSN